MIRFVDIGDQITDESQDFAFFDTVTDTFLDFDGCQTFDNRTDFESWAGTCKSVPADYVERCISLIPEGR